MVDELVQEDTKYDGYSSQELFESIDEDLLFVLGKLGGQNKFSNAESLKQHAHTSKDSDSEKVADLSAQVFKLNRELEKERELSNLAAEKLVKKGCSLGVIREHLNKVLIRKVLQSFGRQSEKEISCTTNFEALKRNFDEESNFLKEKIEQLMQSETQMKSEIKKLQLENMEVVARESTNSFISQAVILYLDDIIDHQENAKAIELPYEVNASQGSIGLKNKQAICKGDRSQILLQGTSKEKQISFIRQADNQDDDRFEVPASEYHIESRDLSEKLEDLGQDFQEAQMTMVDTNNELIEWRTKAESLDAELSEKNEKISCLEKENSHLQRECTITYDHIVEESRKHIEEIANMDVKVITIEQEKMDLLNDIKLLEESVQKIGQKGEEEKILKVRMKQELHDLKEKNEELQGLLNKLQVKKSRKKSWWKRLVSCH